MLKRLRLLRFRLSHRGVARLCNICNWRGSEFYSSEGLSNAVCPVCNSQPRHRLLKAVLDELDFPKKGSRILHVSPKGEDGLEKVFRRLAGWYLSIDKGGGPWNLHPIAMKYMDLTDLDLPDNSVDFVQCSHVLEHIIDDHRAISEIYRVLAPGGMAALQVQIYGSITTRVEEPNAEDYFHVWHPGIDYFQRYKDAGFDVRIFDRTLADTELLAIHGKLLVPICIKHG